MRTLVLLLLLSFSFSSNAASWNCKGRIKIEGKSRLVKFNVYISDAAPANDLYLLIRGERSDGLWNSVIFRHYAKASYEHDMYSITTANLSHNPNIDQRWYFQVDNILYQQKVHMKLIQKCGDNTIMSDIGAVNCSL